MPLRRRVPRLGLCASILAIESRDVELGAAGSPSTPGIRHFMHWWRGRECLLLLRGDTGSPSSKQRVRIVSLTVFNARWIKQR